MDLKLIAIIVSVVISIYYIGHAGYISLNQYVTAKRNMVERYNLTFDFDQPKQLLRIINSSDEIYFESDINPLFFYLTHGFLNHRVVYSYLIDNLESKKKYISENTNLKYAVAYKPTATSPLNERGVLEVKAGDCIRISKSFDLKVNEIGLWVENVGDDIEVTFIVRGLANEEEMRHKMNKKFSDMIWLESKNDFLEIIIYSPGRLLIRGIRLDRKQSTLWPWHRNLTAIIERDGSELEQKINFRQPKLFEQLDLPVRVISDMGSTILTRILR